MTIVKTTKTLFNKLFEEYFIKTKNLIVKQINTTGVKYGTIKRLYR